MTLLFMSMAMVARITAPDVVRIDASRDLGAICHTLRVVHLGQAALVLRSPIHSPDRANLLTITDAAGGVTPGGLSIPGAADYARVRGELAYAGLGSTVDVSGWLMSTDLVGVDLRVSPAPLHSNTIVRVADALARHASLAPTPTFDGGLAHVRSRASDLAVGALTLEASSVLADIIGAGPGTTPTGDDMVVGCLAALAVLGLEDAALHVAEAAEPLLQATTTTSRHYLSAAGSGHFAEHVHNLIAGFAAGHPAERMLAHASRWGATSGVDLLIGLTATLRADLAARTEEEAA